MEKMERITVSFYDEIQVKIATRAKKNGNQSISQCIRELVELGLKVEEASEKSAIGTQENDTCELLLELKNLIRNNLDWSLETRLLARFLVESNPHVTREKQLEVLEAYKERARAHINKLVGETE